MAKKLIYHKIQQANTLLKLLFVYNHCIIYINRMCGGFELKGPILPDTDVCMYSQHIDN